MTKIIFFSLFLLISVNLFSSEFLTGEWYEYDFRSLNYKSGDIEWNAGDKYIFMDENWIRIENKESRHEYKYEVIGQYLKIADDNYIILFQNENKIILLEVYDRVGDLLIDVAPSRSSKILVRSEIDLKINSEE